MQKFYTKIEDRPQVREVVTTFKEHHPIEKVRHPMMHFMWLGNFLWLGNACGMHSIQGHLMHAAMLCTQPGAASAAAPWHAAVIGIAGITRG